MSLTKYFSIVLCTASTLLLNACSSFSSSTGGSPDPLTLLCENLKQDIILNEGLTNDNGNGPSPTKAAAYYKQYDQNNCDDVLSGNTKTTKLTSDQPSS